jgi:hypothetical protein
MKKHAIAHLSKLFRKEQRHRKLEIPLGVEFRLFHIVVVGHFGIDVLPAHGENPIHTATDRRSPLIALQKARETPLLSRQSGSLCLPLKSL